MIRITEHPDDERVIHTPDPPQQWWTDDFIVGEGNFTPITTTASIPIIPVASTTSDDEGVEDTASTQDSPEPYEGIDRFRHLRFFGGVLLQTLIVLMSAALIIMISVVAIGSWSISPILVIVVAIALLVLCTWIYAVFLRRVDNRWSRSNAGPTTDQEPYNRMPHISMFFHSIVIQAGIWIVSYVVVSLAFGLMDAAWYWHWAIQVVVTIVNSYFVLRTYISWTRTRYVVTKLHIIIYKPDLFWLRLRNKPSQRIIIGTLVNYDHQQSALIEKFAYNVRGTALLETQGEGSNAYITLPYIDDINGFLKSIDYSKQAAIV